MLQISSRETSFWCQVLLWSLTVEVSTQTETSCFKPNYKHWDLCHVFGCLKMTDSHYLCAWHPAAVTAGQVLCCGDALWCHRDGVCEPLLPSRVKPCRTLPLKMQLRKLLSVNTAVGWILVPATCLAFFWKWNSILLCLFTYKSQFQMREKRWSIFTSAEVFCNHCKTQSGP